MMEALKEFPELQERLRLAAENFKAERIDYRYESTSRFLVSKTERGQACGYTEKSYPWSQVIEMLKEYR